MRLGFSIIGGRPMRIPGIVDVYQVGNQWIARSWPHPARQPNSALQLFWRQKFRAAHAKLKEFRGWYLDAYRGITCPPGKCWIDVAINSILNSLWDYPSGMINNSEAITLYYRATPFPGWPPWGPAYANRFKFCVIQVPVVRIDYTGIPYLKYHSADRWDQVFSWFNDGVICPKGKRERIRWGLYYKTPEIPVIAQMLVTDRTVPYWIIFFDDLTAPLCMSFLDRFEYPSGTPKKNNLWMPPVFLGQQAWTWGENFWEIDF